MTNIIAPPGCYGTYVARCLHHYTSPTEEYRFDFDQFGSSHAFRKISSSIAKTSLMHWTNLKLNKLNKETTIIITSHIKHQLDYFDNQYFKQSQGNLLEYITETFNNDIVQQGLEKWNYQKPLDKTTPLWILREYFSYNLTDTFKNSYNNKNYLSLPHAYSFCCQDMWNGSMWDIINVLADVLNKKIYARLEDVVKNHQDFLNCQKYHNMQIRCEQFVDDTINQINSVSPCASLFDEAYVQYQLRNRVYEIRCDNLDIFPGTSLELNKYIFKT